MLVDGTDRGTVLRSNLVGMTIVTYRGEAAIFGDWQNLLWYRKKVCAGERRIVMSQHWLSFRSNMKMFWCNLTIQGFEATSGANPNGWGAA